MPKAPVLKPPSLSKFVEAEYPPAAAEQGLTAQVTVELLIAPDGTVQEAKVVQPAGHGFDEAALAAARQLLFNPATQDGAPIPARIHFPYVFEMVQAEEEVPAEALPARFEGRVMSADGDTPIIGAQIKIAAIEGDLSGQTTTEGDGHFYFMEVPPGVYAVTIEAADYEQTSAQETLVAGEALEAIYRLEEDDEEDEVGFGAVARIPPPPREVTRRSIGATQLTRIPGTRGDALRAVELMPGVARPPLGVGALIVRGSAPQDSLTMIEGLPVPLIYHFGGLTSIINSRLLDRIDFYPGNFSTRYGRRRGGILEVAMRDPKKEEAAAILDANLIDASFIVETPITDGWQVALAARRSHIDALLEGTLPDTVSALALPVYYDYQFLTTFQPSENDRLRLMVFGTNDKMELLFTDADDALTAGNFDFDTAFNRAQLSWHHKSSDRIVHDLDVSAGNVDFTFGAGDIRFQLEGLEIYGRGETQMRLTERVRLIAGLDIYTIPGNLTYNGPALEQSTNNPNNMPGSPPPSNRDIISTDSEFTVFQPAIYLESELDLRPVRVVLGNRIDYDNATDTFASDPRAIAHVTVSEALKFKGGIGMFSQPPSFPESNKDLGNPELEQTRTVHVSVGTDYQIGDNIFIGVDGFYKFLSNVVVGTEFGGPPFFTNNGTGRIFGGELSARVEPTGRFFGYLSYTLSRSERSVRGGPYQVFDFDQPHILTVSGTYKLGWGWEAGATFRLVSGNPETPVIGSTFDTGTGQFSPIYGEINSLRDPAFSSLDVRVQRYWDFEDWKLAAYLDIQNVLNNVNPQGLVYNYDFSDSEPIRGLPILPSLGIRGEL